MRRLSDEETEPTTISGSSLRSSCANKPTSLTRLQPNTDSPPSSNETERGVEKQISLEGASSAEEVEKKIASLL